MDVMRGEHSGNSTQRGERKLIEEPPSCNVCSFEMTAGCLAEFVRQGLSSSSQVRTAPYRSNKRARTASKHLALCLVTTKGRNAKKTGKLKKPNSKRTRKLSSRVKHTMRRMLGVGFEPESFGHIPTDSPALSSHTFFPFSPFSALLCGNCRGIKSGDCPATAFSAVSSSPYR